jgi:hypothetical protein
LLDVLVMANKHIVVWIDHSHAKVFDLDEESLRAEMISAPPHHDVHHRDAGRRPTSDHHYYANVAKALTGAEAILVVGPGSAKLELFRHLHRHHAELEHKVVGLETVDHPTDRQVAAYAREYFHRVAKVPHSVRQIV